MPINVSEEVPLHAVPQDECVAPGVRLYDLHTHGLAGRGHMEFQALVPVFCLRDACLLLLRHADEVLNHGTVYRDGETGGDGTGVWRYESATDSVGDPVLRLADAGRLPCDECQRRAG